MNIQIKVIAATSPTKLEKAVNDFMAQLETSQQGDIKYIAYLPEVWAIIEYYKEEE